MVSNANLRAPRVVRWTIVIAATLGLAAWMYVAPPGLLGKLDAVGYAVCHRIDSHSLHIGDRQMPLCARCTGEFNAAAIALIFQAAVSPRRGRLPGRGIAAVLIVLFAAFAVDGTNSYVALLRTLNPGALRIFPSLYATDNVTRVLTGSGMGVALAAVLYPMFNQSIWHRPSMERSLTWGKFAVLVGIIIAVDVGILTEHPLMLYPAAVMSTVGVLALLTMVFSIAWIMIMRQDNAFTASRQLWMPTAAGLTMALIMILGIDLLRLGLTQTWGGFPGLQG